MEAAKVSGNQARAEMLSQMGLALMESRWPRDICIVVGDGTGPDFKPKLSISTGLIGLAHAVAKGDVDAAFVNPSSLLTQAYRGKGLFSEPLDVRTLATYPSWDHYVCAVLPETGLRSLEEVRDKRYPLKVSVREDPTHGTRLLLDTALQALGFTLQDIEAWGGQVSYAKRPADEKRMQTIRDRAVEAVFDEGVGSWFHDALAAGYTALDIGQTALDALVDVGWRAVPLPPERFAKLGRDYTAIDFSGWALYTRASLPEEDAYRLCEAIGAREANIPWEAGTYEGVGHIGQDTKSTPRDVPLHPGAERWYRERGFVV